MCYKNQDVIQQAAMDAWMDEMDAQYIEDKFIEEAAEREMEKEFNYYGEF